MRQALPTRIWAGLLTFLIEALLVLAVLSLGIAPDAVKKPPGSALVSVALTPPAEPAPPAPDKVSPQSARTPTSSTPTAKPVAQPVPAPAVPPPPVIIPVSRNDMAALDISRLPRTPGPPAPRKAMMGPPDLGVPGDSKRIGTAPNGSPLYAAAWYREPYDNELAGYLSTASGPGYALIACRTVAEWRVEDCVALDEYPSGSNLARAVLAAAWQFKVRPPRLGGVYKVGEWVRIRIDYTQRRG